MKLKDSGKVSGILVLNGTTATSSHIPSSYSNDFSCHNKYSGKFIQQHLLFSYNFISYPQFYFRSIQRKVFIVLRIKSMEPMGRWPPL